MIKYILWSLILIFIVGCSSNAKIEPKIKIDTEIESSKPDKIRYFDDQEEFIKNAKIGKYKIRLKHNYKEILKETEHKNEEWRKKLENLRERHKEAQANVLETERKASTTTDNIIETMQDINDLNNKTKTMDNAISNLKASYNKQIDNLKNRISELPYTAIVYAKGYYENTIDKNSTINKLKSVMSGKATEEYVASSVKIYEEVSGDKNGESSIKESISQTKSGMSKNWRKIFVYDYYDYNKGKSIIEAFYRFNVGKIGGDKGVSEIIDEQNTNTDNGIEINETKVINVIDFPKMVKEGKKNAILFSKKNERQVKEVVENHIKKASGINSDREDAISKIITDLKSTIYKKDEDVRKHENRKKLRENEKLELVQNKLPPLFEKLNRVCKTYQKDVNSSITTFKKLNKYAINTENFLHILRFSEYAMEKTLSVNDLKKNLIEQMIKDVSEPDKTFYTTTQLISNNERIKETSSSSSKKEKKPEINKIKYLFKTHRTINGVNYFGIALLFTMERTLDSYKKPRYIDNCFEKKFTEATTNLKQILILSEVKFSIKKDNIIFDMYTGGKQQFIYANKSINNRIYFNKTPFKKNISVPIYNHNSFTSIKFVKEGSKGEGYLAISTRKNISLKSTRLNKQFEIKIVK